ncbi:hypothetical protein ACSV9I_16250 [Rhizobium sp. G187]|uniref:hypothetical protein n=1 Tax=Rhizobium sp. G187 TaxID=3451352 RepID=UPI003EE4E8C1
MRAPDLKNSPLWTDLDFITYGKRSGTFELLWSDNANPLGVYPIPVMTLVGDAGPTVLLTAGVHGDEYEGAVALRRLYQCLDVARLRGRIIIFPQLNAPAFNAASRCSPLDGGNLNRSFAKENSDRPTAQIATMVTECVLPVVDAIVDLHSGGKASWFSPCSLAARNSLGDLDAANMAMARAFGAETIWVLPGGVGNGSLNSAATAKHTPCIAAELGGGGHVGHEALQVAERGLAGVLAHLGMVNAEVTPGKEPRVVELTGPASRITSPRRGLYQPVVTAGGSIEAGETLGWIIDTDDAELPPFEVRARVSGFVLAETRRGLLAVGDFIAFIATNIVDA